MTRELHDLDRDIRDLGDGLQKLLTLVIKILRTHNVNLVDDNKNRLVGKQGLDGVEKLDLVLNGETALLGQIHEVENTRSDVGNSVNRLHLNVVHLLSRTIKNTGSINSLESQVLVVEVTNVQRLGGESIGLDLNISSGDRSEEGRLTHIRVTANQQSSGIGINGRKTAQMLSNLLKI